MLKKLHVGAQTHCHTFVQKIRRCNIKPHTKTVLNIRQVIAYRCFLAVLTGIISIPLSSFCAFEATDANNRKHVIVSVFVKYIISFLLINDNISILLIDCHKAIGIVP